MNHKKEIGNSRILSMVYCSFFTIIIALCSYITIPVIIPFTLQTLGIFTVLELLGGKKGTFSVLLYILLGAAGVPVFSGFRGGIGILLSNTGGYILGFIFLALTYQLITRLLGKHLFIRVMAMLLGLLVCYTFGTLWFIFAYSEVRSLSDIIPVLQVCVLPFLIPDIIKIAVAVALRKILYPALPDALKDKSLNNKNQRTTQSSRS